MGLKVSIIIPCFNQGAYIVEAIESVLNQSITDFEIIIVDDGSHDPATQRILTDLRKPNTRIIRTENKGLAAARNKGFSESQGDYIQFLDADDTLLEGKLESQAGILDTFKNIGVCYSAYRILDETQNKYLSLPPLSHLGDDPLSEFLFRWERGLSIPIHTALFRKNLWKKDPFNEKLRAKEDWVMWCELALENTQFYFLDRELAVYRFHHSNMTRNIIEMNQYFLKAAIHIAQIVPENYRDDFLNETVMHINKSLEESFYPGLVNQMKDLKRKFSETDKTIDFRIGNSLLRPYRIMKTLLTGKKYL